MSTTFNSDDHYIYYCGEESLRTKGIAIMVNKRVRNAVLGRNHKNDRMISVRFQGKLEVVKQETARVNVDILGISELKWTGMVNLTQMTLISTTVGRNPLEEME